MAVKNGVEEITEKKFEEIISKPIVVIDFYAEWCFPCVMMSPILEELSEKFKGKIEFGKVNVDENEKLAGKYKIRSIPTLIIFKKGKEVERITGAVNGEQLEEKLRKLR